MDNLDRVVVGFQPIAERPQPAGGLLPRELSVVLPSEAVWEKGARGGLRVPEAAVLVAPGNWIATADLRNNLLPQRRYPWGDEWDAGRANGEETGIGSTSAVGVFAAQDNVYGAAELSGNVFEWTRSRSGEYPYKPGDGREDAGQVSLDDFIGARGGAFYWHQTWLRCAVRLGLHPSGGYLNYGFRVVVSPISPTADL
ncbi:MAG: SUMF1/EgtB/PvdO family nonheme iron enzyme [Chloroflexota bacterium]